MGKKQRKKKRRKFSLKPISKKKKKKKKKKNPLSEIFANFHGINSPTMVNFKLPTILLRSGRGKAEFALLS